MPVPRASPLPRAVLLWFALSAAGILVLLIPDSGTPVARLSRTHGPSGQDLVGVLLVLAGWAVYLWALWKVRTGIRHRAVLLVAGALAAGLIAWSVGTDSGAWWVLGAGVLVLVQVWAGWTARHATPGSGPPG